MLHSLEPGIPHHWSVTTLLLAGRVSVLDGGFPAWAADGLPVDSSPVPDDQLSAAGRAATSSPASTHYRAELNVRFA